MQHMCMNKDEDAKAWLFAMSDTISQKEFSVLITTLWAIWNARRKVIHEEVLQTPFATHAFVDIFLADLDYMDSPSPAAREAVPRPRGWLPPPEDHSKINSDAAVSRAGRYGAVGVICRDEEGVYQGASAMVFGNIEDPEVLEVLGIGESLALAHDLYIQKVAVA